MGNADRLSVTLFMNGQKQSEKESKELLKNTAPPRQQTGEIRNFTHSPRKVNNYARLVRRMSAKDAVLQLKFLQHAKAARVVLMCLESAMKNARVNQVEKTRTKSFIYEFCGTILGKTLVLSCDDSPSDQHLPCDYHARRIGH